MQKLGIVNITKRFVISEARSRRYLPDHKDGYMWLKKTKETYWGLCDQVEIIHPPKKRTNEKIANSKIAA